LLALLITGCATPGAASSTTFEAPVGATLSPLASARDQERGEPPAEGASLESLLDYATRHHPRLRAEHSRWEAQLARTNATGQWMDPMVSYTFSPLPIETRNGPNRHTFSVSQKIPWPGQTSALQQAERARAGELARTFDASYIAIRLEIEELYWSLWSTTREEALIERELELLRALEASLQARVEVGTRPASDLARLGLELTRRADAVAKLRAQREVQEAMLGQALGLEKTHAIAFPEDLRPMRQPPEVNLDELLSATPTPPHLAALSEEIERRRANQEAITLQKRPSFEVGAQWSLIGAGADASDSEDHSQHAATSNPGRDAVMLRFGVTLPIWTKAIDARSDEAAASTAAAKATLEQARIEWVARLRTALARARDAHRQVILIEGTLLTQATSTLDMVRGDYEANRTELSALLEIIETIYALERDAITQLAARERYISRYNALLGKPLTEQREEAP
jgi:outer membrane protein TolC